MLIILLWETALSILHGLPKNSELFIINVKVIVSKAGQHEMDVAKNKRLEEDSRVLSKKYERMKKMEKLGSTDAVLMEEIRILKVNKKDLLKFILPLINSLSWFGNVSAVLADTSKNFGWNYLQLHFSLKFLQLYMLFREI